MEKMIAANANGNIELEVGPPILIKDGPVRKHHEYKVTGKDSLGAVEAMRRYS